MKPQWMKKKSVRMSKPKLDKSFVIKATGSVKPTEEEVRAFEQWVKDGSVPVGYLRHVLGDQLESVGAFKLGPNDG